VIVIGAGSVWPRAAPNLARRGVKVTISRALRTASWADLDKLLARAPFERVRLESRARGAINLGCDEAGWSPFGDQETQALEVSPTARTALGCQD